MIKILFIGDIIGRPGREKVQEVLPSLIEEESINFVIANGENAAGGKGINPRIVDELLTMGINVITMGNHTWARKEIKDIIHEPRLIRPLNYPPSVPGNGFGIFNAGSVRIGVLQLMGRVYMPHTDCPFRRADEAIASIKKATPVIIVDFHAEITSEKQAMGWYLNGKVSAVIGTHTHIPTADAKILPEGTAYITDCGMVGPSEGIIGVDRELALKRFLTAMPEPFTVALGPVAFNGVIIELDEKTGKAHNIRLVGYRPARTVNKK